MTQKRAWSGSLRDKVDALKRAVDLRDLFLERYPDRFRRSGRWLYGSSPYRRDQHPSFAVNEDVYIDFATGEHGDEVDFVMREQNLSFAEAIAVLEAHAGGALASSAPILPAGQPVVSSYSASPGEPPPAEWQHVMQAECRAAHAYLFSNAPAAKAAFRWLRARGLHRETLRRGGIGFNPAWRPTRLRASETGKALSVPPGIVIPCVVDGALWSVHVRTLTASADLPKYLYVRGSKSSALYNGDVVTDGCTVLVVEGEFDALLAAQELGVVVVTLGSAANRLPRRWFDRLARADRLYSCFDMDAAGRRAAAYLDDQFAHKQHRALTLPIGKDITEYVVSYRGDLRRWWRIETSGDLTAAEQLPLL